MIQPPSTGPSVGPVTTPMPNSALASDSCSRGKVSTRIDCEVESSAPPPMPCTKRKNTSSQMFVACPQKTDATVNSMTEKAK